MPRDRYISLRYQSGKAVDMRLRPGETRRFNDVRPGDYYCYSFSPIGKDCPNRRPLNLDSCSSPASR